MEKFAPPLTIEESKDMMSKIQNLLISSNKVFVGFNETLASLRSGRAEVVLISKDTSISVYDFRLEIFMLKAMVMSQQDLFNNFH